MEFVQQKGNALSKARATLGTEFRAGEKKDALHRPKPESFPSFPLGDQRAHQTPSLQYQVLRGLWIRFFDFVGRY